MWLFCSLYVCRFWGAYFMFLRCSLSYRTTLDVVYTYQHEELYKKQVNIFKNELVFHFINTRYDDTYK
jgi:hypothetical protein